MLPIIAMHFRLLIGFTQNDEGYGWKGYFLSAIFLVNNLMRAVLMQAFQRQSGLAGMRMRMAVTTAIYRKVKKMLITEMFHNYAI